jgi:alkylation response protein AidB-like acyl-CoA dehydrogenase
MYVSPDFGGSGLGRTEGVPVVDALAAACPSTAAYLTIHNMVAAMLDKFTIVF